MASPDWSVYESQNYDGVILGGLKAKAGLPGQPKKSWVKRWLREGMRRTVRAVFLTHSEGVPHLIVFRHRHGEGSTPFLLGGKLAEGEGEREGLARLLRMFVLKDKSSDSCEWKVGEMVGKFFRPEFDERIYPYVPSHVSRPKEEISLFQVVLPPKCVFALRETTSISAVPLHEVIKNRDSYPAVISCLPELIGRFTLYNYIPGRPGFAPLPRY